MKKVCVLLKAFNSFGHGCGFLWDALPTSSVLEQPFALFVFVTRTSRDTKHSHCLRFSMYVC